MSDVSDCPYCGYPMSGVLDQARLADRTKIDKLSDEVRELRVTVARLRGSLGTEPHRGTEQHSNPGRRDGEPR